MSEQRITLAEWSCLGTYKQIQQHDGRDDEEVEFAHELLLGDVVDLVERLGVEALLLLRFRMFGRREINVLLLGDRVVVVSAVGGRDSGFGLHSVKDLKRRHSYNGDYDRREMEESQHGKIIDIWYYVLHQKQKQKQIPRIYN